MNSFIIIGAAALVATMVSCNGPQAVQRSAPYSVTARGIDDKVITHSLFDSKDRSISEEDIQRILNGRIRIPDTVRVAVFKYASTSINRYYNSWWNDEEYLKTQQSFIDTLNFNIRASGKVSRVITVPGLMTSNAPTITQLRETAVRLQADILLVFSITSDIYFRYKVFTKNEAKAYATCEAILMDTRTGVIPHSSIVTRNIQLRKSDEDFNDAEIRKKSERDAIMMALIETGKQVSGFLTGM
jgi:hypothetical protein